MKFKTLLIVPLFVASLQAASVSDLTFTLINGDTEYSVSDCLETASGSLDIPSTYNGLPVTSIGQNAFDGNSSLSSITISDSVTSIGDYAFLGCTGLTSIAIPDSVNSIGNGAFYSCTSLSSITIGDSVTSIGDGAFIYCNSLNSITIPDSVTSIGAYAFIDCTSLTNISFEGNAPTFGTNVFTGSNSATIYYDSNNGSGWSNNVAGRPAVQTNTFTYTLNGDSTEYSLMDCLTTASGSLEIPSSYNGLPVTSIEDWAFNGCSSLTNITIPDSVTLIGSSAFLYCGNLTSITIPDRATSIGSSAFYRCSSLTSITIPDSVTSIGDGAFSYCNSLNSITIPDSVTSIGDSAFSHCTSLTNIQFDGVAPTIGSLVFSNTQVSYTIIEAANAATYGGDGATYGGLVVLDRSKIATAANLYTLDDIKDLRAGSTMIAVENGQATLSMEVEKSDDLGIWTTGGTASVQMNVQPGEYKKFFRFKMTA